MALCLLLACYSSLVCEDCLAGEHCSLFFLIVFWAVRVSKRDSPAGPLEVSFRQNIFQSMFFWSTGRRKRDPKKRETESPLNSGYHATRNTDGKKTWWNLTKDKSNLWGKWCASAGNKGFCPHRWLSSVWSIKEIDIHSVTSYFLSPLRKVEACMMCHFSDMIHDSSCR